MGTRGRNFERYSHRSDKHQLVTSITVLLDGRTPAYAILGNTPADCFSKGQEQLGGNNQQRPWLLRSETMVGRQAALAPEGSPDKRPTLTPNAEIMLRIISVATANFVCCMYEKDGWVQPSQGRVLEKFRLSLVYPSLKKVFPLGIVSSWPLL